MGNRKSIVVTSYGHDKIIDKIVISLFKNSESGRYNNEISDAKTYCDMINSLELKDDSWIFAKIFSENVQYALDTLLPFKFSDVIKKLDNRAIQKLIREFDFRELAKALKDQDEIVKERIFTNISKRASQMLQDEMECMGSVRMIDIKKSQDKILYVLHHLADTGEIVVSFVNPYKKEKLKNDSR